MRIDQQLITAASENDLIEVRILWRFNYFWCGHSEKAFLNFRFTNAIILIGRMNKIDSHNSDYHNGIAYIARKAGVTKSQVKAIKRKYKKAKGYEFKTSYDFDKIIGAVIIALNEIEDKKQIEELLDGEDSIRNFLVFEQYSAIKVAADRSHNDRISRMAIELDGME